MITQNLHLRKLNGALYGKEEERGSNRTLVIDQSKGQVYSSDSIRKGISEQQQRKEAAAAEKRSKANARAEKKEALAKLEAEWTDIKLKHEEAVKNWKSTCERLCSEGVPKKNLLKGPVRPRKPKLPVSFDAVVDEGNIEDEEEDENDED